MTAPASPRAIAWLLSGGEDYGVRRTTLGFMRELRARGIRTPAIVLGEGPLHRDLGTEDEVAFLGGGEPPAVGGSLPRKLLNGFRMLRYGARMRHRVAEAVRSVESDVLHVRWPHLVGLAGSAGRSAGVRVVWQMPNVVGTTLPFGLNRRYLRWLCHRHGVLPIANSRHTATTLGDRDSIPPHAHLGIDPTAFDPAAHVPASRASLGIPDGAFVVGVFARLQPSKGQAELLTAIAALAHLRPEVHLIIAGGPYHRAPGFEEALRVLAQTLSITERAHFVGRVAEPQGYYLACDIVASSTIRAEPFGLSVVEAMMMGRPVLAHALGGPGETVRDGKTGWLVPSATPVDLAHGIERAVLDRPQWDDMGRAARDHAIREFSLASAVDRYLEILASGVHWP